VQIVKIKNLIIKLRKHIALLLLGIFFFPILFQSVHIFWHHSHGYKCEHFFYHKKTSDNDSLTKHVNTSEEEETCLICEYKFPINDSPKVFFFSTTIPTFVCVINEIDKQLPYKPVFSDKTPRAPPVLIS